MNRYINTFWSLFRLGIYKVYAQKTKVLTKVHSPSFNPFVYPFIIIVITHEGAKMLVREVKEACLYTLNVYIFIADKVAVCVYLRRVRLLPPS